MRADIETRRCARTNRETMQVMLSSSSGQTRFPLPPVTLVVPVVVAVVTFLLALFEVKP
jgi:hypothetical protein